MIAGWKIGEDDRRTLLKQFPTYYGEIVADHVTLRFRTDAETPLPTATNGEIVGEAEDGS